MFWWHLVRRGKPDFDTLKARKIGRTTFALKDDGCGGNLHQASFAQCLVDDVFCSNPCEHVLIVLEQMYSLDPKIYIILGLGQVKHS